MGRPRAAFCGNSVTHLAPSPAAAGQRSGHDLRVRVALAVQTQLGRHDHLSPALGGAAGVDRVDDLEHGDAERLEVAPAEVEQRAGRAPGGGAHAGASAEALTAAPAGGRSRTAGTPASDVASRDGGEHGLGEHGGRGGADGGDVGAHAGGAGREREHRVSVEHRVHGVDGARQAVVRHLRDLGCLRLGELGVGGHDRKGRALADADLRRVLAQPLRGADEASALPPRPGDHGAARRVDHVAGGVDRHQRADGDPAGEPHARRAEPALGGTLEPRHLAHGRPGAGADTALRHRPSARRLAGRLAGGRVRAHVRAPHRQVEEHGRGDDGHAQRAHLHPAALLLQPAHHATGGVQPEGAPAADQHRVHALHRVHRVEQVGLPRARRRTAHVHAGHGAVAVAQHHRAPRRRLQVGPVAHRQPAHIG